MNRVRAGQVWLHSRWFGLRIPLRGLVMGSLIVAAALLCASITLGVGDFALSPGRVLDVLLGSGSRAARLAVLEWRLPAALASLLFGALLGAAGAIFQSLTRNPLGSPDVIGFDAGSYAAVAVTLLLFGSTDFWTLAGAAIAGGLVTAVVVYALAAVHGGAWGFRLIIVGIAISALLGSVNSYLITVADQTQIMAVGFWAAGSLSRVAWSNLPIAVMIGGAILIGIVLASRPLKQLELGDDTARAHGVSIQRQLRILLALGVAASATVTAATGPIAFIALAAPQIAARLTRSPGISIASATVTGALLLAAAHLLTSIIAVRFQPIPVGLITVCGGGIYLIALLIRERRRRTPR
ncbi:iron ABC transporter permease [Enemella evansiae]|uniref:FecCD family ABC transporter permease n=1 Tax=Enemella evansiae TaxID=2016499 RepID=UPI000B971932|nr:iron chelate uptake ABC transporter family permease subunit [Enemella evansiae]OYN93340.1 iron ABC transporter permease [Enemella evansiae]